jgi:hypothetical protein
MPAHADRRNYSQLRIGGGGGGCFNRDERDRVVQVYVRSGRKLSCRIADRIRSVVGKLPVGQ